MARLQREEIIAYALAHAVVTLDWSPDDDDAAMEILIEFGTSDAVGIDIPLGDEYQRAVLHRFDPERVPDFPLPDAEEHQCHFNEIHSKE